MDGKLPDMVEINSQWLGVLGLKHVKMGFANDADGL